MIGLLFCLLLLTMFINFFGGLAFSDFKSRLGKVKSFLVTVVVSTIINGVFLSIPLPLTVFAASSTETIILSWFTILVTFPLISYWLFRVGWSLVDS